MTFVNHTASLSNDNTPQLVSQNHLNFKSQVRLFSYRSVVSILLSGALAFTGGFGFAAIQDLANDGSISFLSNG